MLNNLDTKEVITDCIVIKDDSYKRTYYINKQDFIDNINILSDIFVFTIKTAFDKDWKVINGVRNLSVLDYKQANVYRRRGLFPLGLFKQTKVLVSKKFNNINEIIDLYF